MFKTLFPKRYQPQAEQSNPLRRSQSVTSEQTSQSDGVPALQNGPAEDLFSRQVEADLEAALNAPPVILNKKEILAQRMTLGEEMSHLNKVLDNPRRWNEASAIRYEEAHQEFVYLGKLKDKKPQEREQIQAEQPFEVNYDELERAVERKRPKSAKQAKQALSLRVQEAQERMNLHRAGRLPRRPQVSLASTPAAQPQPQQLLQPILQAPTQPISAEPEPAASIDNDLLARLEALRRG